MTAAPADALQPQVHASRSPSAGVSAPLFFLPSSAHTPWVPANTLLGAASRYLLARFVLGWCTLGHAELQC